MNLTKKYTAKKMEVKTMAVTGKLVVGVRYGLTTSIQSIPDLELSRAAKDVCLNKGWVTIEDLCKALISSLTLPSWGESKVGDLERFDGVSDVISDELENFLGQKNVDVTTDVENEFGKEFKANPRVKNADLAGKNPPTNSSNGSKDGVWEGIKYVLTFQFLR